MSSSRRESRSAIRPLTRAKTWEMSLVWALRSDEMCLLVPEKSGVATEELVLEGVLLTLEVLAQPEELLQFGVNAGTEDTLLVLVRRVVPFGRGMPLPDATDIAGEERAMMIPRWVSLDEQFL